MNLVNKQVKHGVFGKGKVVQYDELYVQVDFPSGVKKFVYPDAFGTYLTLVDQKAASFVEKLAEKSVRKKEEQRLERIEAIKIKTKQRLFEQERLSRRSRTMTINPRSQSVFWCKPEELDSVFGEWQVFTGEIKSGRNKGQPKRLARISQNSACLVTVREPDMPEKDRRIAGLFMVGENFNPAQCTDGYIPAHSKYRYRLSEEKSAKMLFWNYYINERAPHRVTWNTGRHRYFDNPWMAQILRDMIALEKKPQERDYLQRFFEYFCRVNRIDQEKLPERSGALAST